MTEEFFDFIKTPSKELFLKSQQYVIEHKNYDPYTRELDDLMEFMDAEEFQKVIDFKSINTLLSPSAHYMKYHAATQIHDDLNAQSELFLYQKILVNIMLTGDGSKEQPYLITQISDERDLVRNMGLEVDRQSLVQIDDKSFDMIKTKSGKTIYFDITKCMQVLAAKFNTSDIEEGEGELELDQVSEESEEISRKTSSNQEERETSEKKWWKFW